MNTPYTVTSITNQGLMINSNNINDVLSKIIKNISKEFSPYHTELKASWFDTKLGAMIAIADDEGLYLLEFVDTPDLEKELKSLQKKIKAVIIPGSSGPIESIKLELQAYFDGTLTEFKTPIHLLGTSFQRLAWKELMHTPYGQTRTYANQAKAIGKATAYRAVANANGMNKLTIVIPCHRIIRSNGNLGGYSSGLSRKQWLIEHERQNT